jgi:hypothetical protein
MASNITLQDIRERAMQRAYVDVTGSNGPVTTTEVNRQINAQHRRFRLRMAHAAPRLFASEATITITAGTSEYDLANVASDFAFLQCLHVLESGRYRELHPLTDAQLVAVQAPQESGTVRMRYTAVPADMTNDANTIDGVMGLEEWLVCAVARDILIKQKMDITAVQVEMQELEKDILNAVSLRDSGLPEYVTEIEYLDMNPYYGSTQLVGYQLRGNYLDFWGAAPVWP